MENFAAIDFETANRERSSVCSVGIVIVKNGKNRRQDLSANPPLPELLQLLEHPSTWSGI